MLGPSLFTSCNNPFILFRLVRRERGVERFGPPEKVHRVFCGLDAGGRFAIGGYPLGWVGLSVSSVLLYFSRAKLTLRTPEIMNSEHSLVFGSSPSTLSDLPLKRPAFEMERLWPKSNAELGSEGTVSWCSPA